MKTQRRNKQQGIWPFFLGFNHDNKMNTGEAATANLGTWRQYSQRLAFKRYYNCVSYWFGRHIPMEFGGRRPFVIRVSFTVCDDS